MFESNKDGKDLESIQSSTSPDPGRNRSKNIPKSLPDYLSYVEIVEYKDIVEIHLVEYKGMSES